MNKISSLFVFVMVRANDEKMVMYPNEDGVNVPLIYASHDVSSKNEMKKIVQEMADESKGLFELREYVLNEKAVELFYPADRSFYNA